VRNPLSAIKTAAQFLQSQYSRDEVASQFAGIINSECDRLTKVTTDFLVYARPPSPHFEPVRLENVIERSLQLMEPESEGCGIQVDCDYPRTLPTLLADPLELEQVFLNLLTNAAQAVCAWLVAARFKNVISWPCVVAYTVAASLVLVALYIPLHVFYFKMPWQKMLNLYAFQTVLSIPVPAIFLRALLGVIRNAGFVEE
jgi:nitrogen fixation/metabolism regulation signal transduction histidine kinase